MADESPKDAPPAFPQDTFALLPSTRTPLLHDGHETGEGNGPASPAPGSAAATATGQ